MDHKTQQPAYNQEAEVTKKFLKLDYQNKQNKHHEEHSGFVSFLSSFWKLNLFNAFDTNKG